MLRVNRVTPPRAPVSDAAAADAADEDLATPLPAVVEAEDEQHAVNAAGDVATVGVGASDLDQTTSHRRRLTCCHPVNGP